MKTFITIALFGLFAGMGKSSAVEDSVSYSSPDGSITVRNIGDSAAPDHHFQIVGRSGGVMLSSAKHPDLESGAFAENILWASDGACVAFSVRTSGPHIRDTFIYSVLSKQLVRVPTKDDDYQTRPVRWHDNHTLIVQTDAPYGGKATEDKVSTSYRYRRTIRISGSPLQLDTLFTTPRTHPK
jgi:hypothetical protein